MSGLPPIEHRTLLATYERVLAGRPHDIGQTFESESCTFEQSWQRSLALAAGLLAHGVAVQRPVAVFLDNSLDTAHVWAAIGLVGLIELPVNTAYKGRFLTHILNDSGAELIVIEDHYVDRLALVADELRALNTVVVRGDVRAADVLGGRFRVVALAELGTHGSAQPAPGDPAALMAYMYTSGTTGVSKGVLVTHAHAYTYASREDQERPHADDRTLVALPLFHLTGLWFGVYQSLIHQLPCVITPGFSASRYWSTVREHRLTNTVMLGAMAEILQQQPPRSDDADNPLEFAVMAPLASDVKGFSARFGVACASGYGMSEIGTVLCSPPERIVGGECGFPREFYDVKLMGEDGTEVATGEIGELWVRPDNPLIVMQGYLNQPEKTAETLVDGWVRTGDAFRMDAEGRYFFADRMKDALRRRGENVSSFEVERVINEFPPVYESAAVGVPADLGEDEIKAVIVPREGQTVDPVELTNYLIERMPYFMVPRYLEFVDELPKTPTLKILKNVLRDRGVSNEVWDREAAGIVVNRSTR
jgi:crotonobetaine/carnitine-CoA ligase